MKSAQRLSDLKVLTPDALQSEFEKLKKEQAMADWVFRVPKWTMDAVLKERSALMTEKKAEPAAAGAGGDAAHGDADHDHAEDEKEPAEPVVPLAPPQ